MKIERLDFKEFSTGLKLETAKGSKVFIPSHKPKVDDTPPPPPVFSEDDLKAAEREGYKKGFIVGEQEGRKQMESQQADINSKLVNMAETFVLSVSPIFGHYRRTMIQLQKDVPAIALAIARKVAGDALEKNAEAVIADIAMRCCESMISEPELTIVAHESMADTLQARLQEMATRLPAATHIVIMRDPNMPLSDCRIEWHNGSMERRTQVLWQKIEAATASIAVMAEKDAQAQMENLDKEPEDITSSSEKE